MKVKLPFVPTVNVDAFALVIAGGWFTTSVKVAVLVEVGPFDAVTLK